MQGNPIREQWEHPIENWKVVIDRVSALVDWSWRKKTPPEGKYAVATLEGESGVSGVINFLKEPDGSIKVSGEMKGLAEGKHGLHVHEYGNSTGGCDTAGPHFNPFNKTHGSPTNHNFKDDNRHMGDLGNVEANAAGVAKFTFTDKCIRLSGPYSIVGRSLVIHAGEDDLGRGTEDKREESLKTGNAGARVACGVIGHSSAG